MVRVKIAALATAAAMMTTLADAADMPMPIIEEVASGWYLRGDIGMSNQRLGSMFNVLYNNATSVVNVQKDFDSAPTFGLGFGYQFNDWLRVDLTGEYRGKANFHGFDLVYSPGAGTDEYRASKSEWLVLANIYADLGTWYGLTPFIGAGVGASRVTIGDFKDIGVVGAGGGYADSASKWNFAWALHAGIAYHVNSRLSLEFAYRYVNLGNGITGDIITYTGVNAVYNPMEFKNITSHDLKFGVRWLLDGPMYPLISKG